MRERRLGENNGCLSCLVPLNSIKLADTSLLGDPDAREDDPDTPAEPNGVADTDATDDTDDDGPREGKEGIVKRTCEVLSLPTTSGIIGWSNC